MPTANHAEACGVCHLSPCGCGPMLCVRCLRNVHEGPCLAMRARPTEQALRGAIAFIRDNWTNDGAEGESVHLVVDELERRLDGVAEGPPANAIAAQEWDAGYAAGYSDAPGGCSWCEPPPGGDTREPTANPYRPIPHVRK